jgi:glycosyl transferase family 1
MLRRMARTALTWPVDPAWARSIRIAWPTQYDWVSTHFWADQLRSGFELNGVRVEPRDIPQEHLRAVVFDVELDGDGRRVTFDYNDYFDVDEQAASQSLRYFKVNFLSEGYPQRNVIPGGYMPGNIGYYEVMPRLRAMRRLRPWLPYDVYSRLGLRFPSEIRVQAMDILTSRDDFRFVGGLHRYEGGPDKQPYRTYLREITRAKVCVDMPNGGDLTMRLVDCLGIGSCVVRPQMKVALHVPLVDGEHVAFCRRDLADLGDLCARLVGDRHAREAIARGAADYFDRYLDRRQLAAYYLHEIAGAWDEG